MGVDRQIYLGPVFIGYPQKTSTDIVEKMWLCNSAKCPDFNHGGLAAGKERRKRLPSEAQFCTKCGHPSVCADVVTGQEETETPEYVVEADGHDCADKYEKDQDHFLNHVIHDDQAFADWMGVDIQELTQEA